MSEERVRLLAQLEASRSRLNDLIGRFNTSWNIYPPWKLKQILDHIAGWDDAIINSLRAHARGDVPAVTAPLGIDPYNAETVITRETLPYDRSLREFHRTREILNQTIMELPEDKFSEPLILPWGPTGTVEEIIAIFVHHEHEHSEDLEAILHERGL